MKNPNEKRYLNYKGEAPLVLIIFQLNLIHSYNEQYNTKYSFHENYGIFYTLFFINVLINIDYVYVVLFTVLTV